MILNSFLEQFEICPSLQSIK